MEMIFKRNNRVEEDQEGLSRSFKHCVHAQQQRPSAWCNNRDQSNHIHIFWHYFICSSSPPSTFHRRCLSCVLLFLFMLKKKISKLFLICAQPQNIQSKVIKTLSIMGQGKRSQPIPAKKKSPKSFLWLQIARSATIRCVFTISDFDAIRCVFFLLPFFALLLQSSHRRLCCVVLGHFLYFSLISGSKN